MNKRPLMTALVVAMTLILASCRLGGQDDKNSGDKAPASTTTASPTTTTLSADAVANQINEKFTGFAPGQLKIGSKNVVFKGAAEERGTAAFSKRTLKTPRQVGAFLNEKTDVSRAAKRRVIEAIRKAGYGDAEVKRALNGSGYFPLQVTVASQIMGTTYYKDGKVYEMGEWRAVGPNDVFWLFLTKDRQIIFDATVRADCGNPRITKVTPVPPGPPPPPIEQLCPRKGDVPDANGLCPKHPEDDPMNNPEVPDQVKGPGSTPPSGDPGPAIQPVDSPTGCRGPCPMPVTTSTQPPTTTTSTLPPSTTPVVTDPPAGPPPPPPPSD